REVDALSRLDVARGARDLRDLVPRADVSRTAAGRRSVRRAGAHLHRPLLPVLPGHAHLHIARSREAGSSEVDLPCARLRRWRSAWWLRSRWRAWRELPKRRRASTRAALSATAGRIGTLRTRCRTSPRSSVARATSSATVRDATP